MKLILLLIVSSAVANGALLGTNKCTYGPSYWCASLENAKECSAYNHCLEKKWKTTSNVGVNSIDNVACDYCKDIISDVTDFIKSNKTVATVQYYLKKACDFMPDSFSKDECDKIGTHYFDEFLDLIKNKVDPATMCQLVRLCPQNETSAVKQLMLQPSKTNSLKGKSDDMCTMCKSAVAMAKSEVDNKQNQDAMKQMMENQCQKLGGDLAAECKTLVDMFFPQFIAMLDSELSDQLCVLLHLCTNSTKIDVMAVAKATFVNLLKQSELKSHILGVASRVKSDACTTCEEIINYVKLFISNNETEQQVMSVLENDVCPQLGEFSSTCKELVEQYFPQLWSKFLELLDPKTLCTDLGLCNSSLSVSSSPKTTPKLVKARTSVQCVVCEFVINKLEGELANNATESQIVHAVEKICTILPSTIKTECDALIEKYGAAIIHMLIKDISPSIICTTLGLCSAGDSLYKRPLLKVGDESCTMCELAISYVKSMLTKNATEQEIMNVLEKVCNFLSGSFAQKCNTMIEQYAPQLLKMLTDDIDAKTICTTIGLCQGRTREVDGLVHLYNRKVADNI